MDGEAILAEPGRVGDRVGPGAFRLLGDHRVGAAGEQRLDRALGVGRVERAVRAFGQLVDLAHHVRLVRLGLRAGRVVVEHDLGRLVRIGAGIVPALHRGLHEARHLVDEGRVLELVLQHVEAVLERGDALVLILEDDEVLRLDAGVDHLPVLVVGHGRDAVGLLLDQRIDVEALLQHGDAVGAAVGRQAELAHPGEERILVAEEPDAERLALEVGRRLDAGVLAAGQLHAGAS